MFVKDCESFLRMQPFDEFYKLHDHKLMKSKFFCAS